MASFDRFHQQMNAVADRKCATVPRESQEGVRSNPPNINYPSVTKFHPKTIHKASKLHPKTLQKSRFTPPLGRSSPCIGQNNTSKRFSFFEEIFGVLRGCRVQESSKSVDFLEGPGGGQGGAWAPRGGATLWKK